MKKVIIGLSIALLAFGAVGCKKDKKETTTAAAPAAEELQQIEAKYQRQDTSAPAGSDLTCKFILVQGSGGSYTMSKAELKTSGQCNWADLQGKAATAGAISAAQAAQIVAGVAAGGLPASAKDKWNCTAYNIATNGRRVGVQDCEDGSGAGQNLGKTISTILGL